MSTSRRCPECYCFGGLHTSGCPNEPDEETEVIDDCDQEPPEHNIDDEYVTIRGVKMMKDE
jgi:hypothetical protein